MAYEMNGRSCVLFSRTAGDAAGFNSQAKCLRQFAEEHGLMVKHEVHLVGVSSGSPKNAAAIDHIIHRKQRLNDFEVLLVSELSQLSRQGAEEGTRLLHRLASNGIRVVVSDIGDLTDIAFDYVTNEAKTKERGSRNAKEKTSGSSHGRSAGNPRGRTANPAGNEFLPAEHGSKRTQATKEQR